MPAYRNHNLERGRSGSFSRLLVRGTRATHPHNKHGRVRLGIGNSELRWWHKANKSKRDGPSVDRYGAGASDNRRDGDKRYEFKARRIRKIDKQLGVGSD